MGGCAGTRPPAGHRFWGRGPGPCGGLPPPPLAPPSPRAAAAGRASAYSGQRPVVRTGRLLVQVLSGSLLWAAGRASPGRGLGGLTTRPPPAPDVGQTLKGELWAAAGAILLSPQVTRPDAQAASRHRALEDTALGPALSPALGPVCPGAGARRRGPGCGEQTSYKMRPKSAGNQETPAAPEPGEGSWALQVPPPRPVQGPVPEGAFAGADHWAPRAERPAGLQQGAAWRSLCLS